MAIKIGLMGFGRIGRNIFRILHRRNDVQVTAISDTADPKALEYLLRFDTVLGRFPEELSIRDGVLDVSGSQIPVLAGRRPGDVDWSRYGAEIVIEASAQHRTREELEAHLHRGARRVILCAPPKDAPDITVVIGVNEDRVDDSHKIISNASCTAHCLGTVAKVLHGAFGVAEGFVSTVHAYTNAQRLADVPAADMRSSRAAVENIIPSETRAHEIVMELIPELAGRLGGLAINVPVPDGSVIDFVARLERRASVQAVNAAVREAAGGPMKGLIEYETEPIVSSDVIGNPHSAVFDSLGTLMLGEDLVKVLAWFDNGWGYANRVVELATRVAGIAPARRTS